jgi:hypothetical protein
MRQCCQTSNRLPVPVNDNLLSIQDKVQEARKLSLCLMNADIELILV